MSLGIKMFKGMFVVYMDSSNGRTFRTTDSQWTHNIDMAARYYHHQYAYAEKMLIEGRNKAFKQPLLIKPIIGVLNYV